MNCPKCGKEIHSIKVANLNGYFALLVHAISHYRGHNIIFKEDEGCFITEEEYNTLYDDGEDKIK